MSGSQNKFLGGAYGLSPAHVCLRADQRVGERTKMLERVDARQRENAN